MAEKCDRSLLFGDRGCTRVRFAQQMEALVHGGHFGAGDEGSCDHERRSLEGQDIVGGDDVTSTKPASKLSP